MYGVDSMVMESAVCINTALTQDKLTKFDKGIAANSENE